jgi:hypothetical protein
LDRIEPLLVRLRGIEGLTEKSRGTFYRRGRAFLHFHADITGTYVDLRLVDDFERRRVKTVAEQRSLVRDVQDALS